MFSWSAIGDVDGPVVVYCHGTPGSRHEVPHPEVVDSLGVRLLTFDRPGYGDSAPWPRASLLQVAGRALDDLRVQGVERCAVLGWSGGGPHALAFAAAAPDRVRAVGLIASWAPMNPPDAGLPLGVRFAMRVGASAPRAALRAMLRGSGRKDVGMTDDVVRVSRPWGFAVDEVAARTRVCAWHAEHDPQVPVGPWRGLAGVDLTVLPGAAHDISPETWAAALREVTTAD